MSIVELAKNFPTLLYSPSLSLNPTGHNAKCTPFENKTIQYARDIEIGIY